MGTSDFMRKTLLVVMAALVAVSPLVSCGVAADPAESLPLSEANGDVSPLKLRRFEHRSRHMGTGFRFEFYATDEAVARRAIVAADRRIASLDGTLSDYRSDSEISRLSASAPHVQPVAVSEDLFRVLRVASEISRQSGGAFDVTVGPLSRLWRRARRTGKWPADTDISAAKTSVGFEQLQLNAIQRAIQLKQSHMRLDVGGIAKGDALDQTLATFYAHGIRRVLVDGGGDIIVGDAPPGQSCWKIEIAGFRTQKAKRETLYLQNVAVATSGDLWQWIEHEGVRYSHVIDPRTGQGVTRRSIVTVIAPRAIDADAWASALTVLGPAGIATAAEHTQAARLVYLNGGKDDMVPHRRVTRNWHTFEKQP